MMNSKTRADEDHGLMEQDHSSQVDTFLIRGVSIL